MLLTVSSTTSFSFQTVTVLTATLNEFWYSTQLVTNAAPTDTVTYHVLNFAQLPVDSATATLPPGISLFNTADSQGYGDLQGVLLEAGNFSFLVEAIDSQGGVAEQAFTIQVVSPKAPSFGVVASRHLSSGFGWATLAGLDLRLRRRTSRRRIGS